MNIEVKDPVKFQEYREKVAPLIAKFGGRYLIRGGELRRLEGNPPLNRLVVGGVSIRRHGRAVL